jgi:hypothetical protein
MSNSKYEYDDYNGGHVVWLDGFKFFFVMDAIGVWYCHVSGNTSHVNDREFL